MALQYKFFRIPVFEPEWAENELNSFIRNVRAVNVTKEFVAQGDYPFWNIVVEYVIKNEPVPGRESENRKGKIDYKEILSNEDFEVYSKIRDWRKKTAIQNGLQVYNIIKNAQMAEIAEKRITTMEGLKAVKGIGDSTVEDYGKTIIDIVAGFSNNDEPAKESDE